jgi:SDR family mycofactocin-dependent oxidoreductase
LREDKEAAMGRFEGKVVMITGAAKGQGRRHALGFAAEGATLAICDIARQLETAGRMGTESDLADTAGSVRAAGAVCLAKVADVRDDGDLQSFTDEVLDAFSRIDVLIANAGIASYAPFGELPLRWWQEMVDINLGGVANAIRAVAPHMASRGSGRIVATSSAAAREGVPNACHYAAAKWGVVGLVKSAALELGASGITVNAVCPMSVDTDMCHNEQTYRLFRPDLLRPTRDEVAGTFADLNAMRVPWLRPEDVTAAVLFLASDDARYVTGTALDVAAGWNAKHLA